MNNLIPERRTDKNGVTSTKWVRPAVIAGKGKLLPAPKEVTNDSVKRLLTKSEHKALTAQLINRARFLYQRPDDRQGEILDSLHTLLQLAPDETAIALRDYLMPEIVDALKHDNRLDFLKELMNLHLDEKYSTPEGREKQIAGVNGYLAYIPHLSVSIRAPYGISMIRGLHKIEQLPQVVDYSTVDSRTRDRITALLTATTIIHKSLRATPDRGTVDALAVSPSIHIKRSDLVDIILEHPAKAEDIANILAKDKVLDVDLIRDRITSSTQSLREGML